MSRMKVIAKCHNYSGCLVAYRGEQIELEQGAAMVCPECGKPVTPAPPGGSKIAKIIGVLIALGVLGAAAYFGYPTLMKKAAEKPKSEEPKTEQQSESVAPPRKTEQPAKTEPTSKPAQPVSETRVAEPPKEITAPAKLDLNAGNNETKQVKDEVLKRIDLMPNVSQANKDKLYASVQRARSMGKVLTIPFASGKTTFAPSDVQALKAQLETPELLKLRDDPTAVFVLLGYADPKGDAKKNLEVSQNRADAVLATMRDKCGVINVMHSVAMGGSTLVDAEKLEKNRIVEVWAVLP